MRPKTVPLMDPGGSGPGLTFRKKERLVNCALPVQNVQFPQLVNFVKVARSFVPPHARACARRDNTSAVHVRAAHVKALKKSSVYRRPNGRVEQALQPIQTANIAKEKEGTAGLGKSGGPWSPILHERPWLRVAFRELPGVPSSTCTPRIFCCASCPTDILTGSREA